MDEGVLSKMLVVVSDMTEAREAERVEREQREILGVFERIMRDKTGFLQFFSETGDLVEILMGSDLDLPYVKRLIHTVKGNAAIFGVTSISDLCHEFENTRAESGALSTRDRERLGQAWSVFRARLQSLLGDQSSRGVLIQDNEYEAILSALVQGTPRTDLVRIVRDWRRERLEDRMTRIADQIRGLSTRLGKGEAVVDVDANGLRLDAARWASFWAAFTHVVRNTVDHGFETPAERQAAGKSERCRASLRARQVPGKFTIEISDDGRGIDWEILRAKAAGKGLPSVTQDDLVEALFSDGVSTKDEANENSGRGVGMGAVREACRHMGGQIDVRSEKGKGTTFQFAFPATAMVDVEALPVPQASLAPTG